MKPKDEDLKIILLIEIKDKKYHTAVYLEEGRQTKEKFWEMGESILMMAFRKLCEEEIIKK